MTTCALIVDDHAANLALLEHVLSHVGYAVSTAVDAPSALAQIALRKPDVILMDLQLPGLDGLELSRQLKEDPATRTICIVAVTSYAMPGDQERARAAGCDGYITKPIDTRRLPEIVSACMEGKFVWRRGSPKTHP